MTVKTNQLRQLSYLVRGFPGSSLRTRGELGESSSEKAPLLGSRDSLGEMFDKKSGGFGIIEQCFEYVLYVGVLCVLTMVQKGCTSLDPHQ